MSQRGPRALRRIARADLEADRVANDRGRVDALAAELDDALARGDIAPRYQPVVDMRSGMCVRVEVLVRWRHRSFGEIDPRDVVHLARSRGRLATLAEHMLRVAARDRIAWRDEGLDIALSVNLTGDELAGGTVDALHAAMSAEASRPSLFTFEVPARRALDDDVRPHLRRLASGGARISLDETSDADRLTRRAAPDVDEVKIARPLVVRLASDGVARRAVRVVLEAAHDLGLSVVAVGVEDRVTCDVLAGMGCDLAQGHWMSRPLAVEQLPGWRRMLTRVAFGGAAAVVGYTGSAQVALGAQRAVASSPAAGPADGQTCCALHAPSGAADTGVATTTARTAAATVHVETSLDAEDARRVEAAVARDIPAVERDLGSSFGRAPDVYVFATRASFAFALQRGFGQRATDAAALSATNGGVALPQLGAIVVNWEAVRGDASLAIVRHELTHLLAHQIAGPDAQLPAWFDEGLASLEERRVAPDAIRDARDASTTLALLRDGRVSLADLASTSDWSLRNARLDGRAYAVATEAVRMLEETLGGPGIGALLRRSHDVGFADAFGEATGTTLAGFAQAFPARFAVTHGAPEVRWQPGAGGDVWSASGFVPGARLHVAIDGAGYHVEFDAVADRDGVYSAAFGTTAPPGDYTVAVSSGASSASARLVV